MIQSVYQYVCPTVQQSICQTGHELVSQ